MNLNIRAAHPDELEIINRHYKDVNFVPSAPNHDCVVATANGEIVGMGRVVHMGNHEHELGGILVLEGHRLQGIAGKLVSTLLSRLPKEDTVYCLPFSQLEKFYSRYGFVPCDQKDSPKGIEDKLRWCNETYSYETLLMVRKAAQHQSA